MEEYTSFLYEDPNANASVLSDNQSKNIAAAKALADGSDPVDNYTNFKQNEGAALSTLDSMHKDRVSMIAEEATNQVANNMLHPDVAAAAITDTATNSLTPTQTLYDVASNGKTLSTDKLSQMTTLYHLENEAQRIAGEFASNWVDNTSLGTKATDVFEVLTSVFVPQMFTQLLLNYYREVGGDKFDINGIDNVLSSSSQERLRLHYMGSSDQEQIAMQERRLNWMRDTLSSMDKSAALPMLLAMESFAVKQDPTMAYVSDVADVFDVAALASLPVRMASKLHELSKSYKLMKQAALTSELPNSGTVNVITEANPDLGASIKAAVFDDEQAAKDVGTTPEEIALDALPAKTIIESGKKGGPELRFTLKEKDKPGRNFLTSTNIFTREDKEAVAINKLEEYKSVPDQYALERFVVDEHDVSDTSLTVRAIYGSGKRSGGFSSEAEVYNTLEKLGIEDTAYRVHNVGDEINPEFFLEIRHDYDLKNKDALAFDGAPIVRGYTPISRHLVSNAWKASDFVRDTAQIAHDRTSKVKGVLKDTQSAINISKLSYKERNDLSNVLSFFAGHSGESSLIADKATLKEMGLSNRTIDAYYDIDMLRKQLFMVSNSQHRSDSVRDGQRLISTSIDKVFIGKPLERTPNLFYDIIDPEKANGSLYDPIGNKVISINSKDDLDKLLSDNDVRIFETKGMELDGDAGTYTHVVLRGTEHEIRDLPETLLRYKPGYVPMNYTNNYFIEVPILERINGKDVESSIVVAAADTTKRANAIMNTLDMEELKLNHRVNGDPIIRKAVEKDTKYWDYDTVYTGHGKKGIVRQDQLITGGTLEDPITAFEQAINNTAQRVGYNQTLSLLEQRFLRTYGKYLEDPEDMNSNWVDTSFHEFAQAEYFKSHYMKFLRGVADPVDTAVQNSLGMLAEHLADMGYTTASKIAQHGSKASLAATVKGLTFNMLLATNFLRAFVLNASQFSYIAGMDMANATRSVAMMYALLPSSDINKAAKVLNLTPSDIINMRAAYNNTGIKNSITSHMHAVDGINETSTALMGGKASHYAQRAWNITKAPLRGAQKIGFNAGESVNLALTYSFAFLRKSQELGKSPAELSKSPDILNEIHATAKTLALSPNKPGSFDWQSGIASFATQFLAFQLKAVELLMYGVKSGVMTKAERRKLLLTQTALWGAGGMGAASAWDYAKEKLGINPSAEVDVAVHGGIADWLAYRAINVATDDESRLAMSESMSPLPKVDKMAGAVYDFVVGNADPKLASTFLGASGAWMGTLGGAVKDVYLMFRTPEASTDDKLATFLTRAAELSPLLSNTMKATIAYNTGEVISRYDYSSTGLRLNAIEYMTTAFIGVQSQKSLDYYKQHGVKYSEGEQVKQYAQEMVKAYNTLIVAEGSDITPERRNEIALTVQSMLIGKPQYFADKVFTAAKKDMLGESSPGVQIMIQSILKRLDGLEDPDMLRAIYKRDVEYNMSIPEEERKMLKEYMNVRTGVR